LTSFEGGKPIQDFPAEMSISDAYALQREYVALLKPSQGDVIGYKAAITGAKLREMIGAKEPVRGFLLARMVAGSGSRINVDSGVAPFMEGDLIVRVGSEAINRAADRMDVLAGLDAVMPFLEVVDLLRASTGGSVASLIAANAGAYKGVIGTPIAIEPTEEWMDRLGQIRVELYEDDRLLSQGDTRQLYGHPVDAVIWIRNSLAADGIDLKPGDLLSLGSVAGSLKPPKSGTRLRAVYEGLTDGETAEVVAVIE
jgi:2-keto-4-pentenoate hydratase